MKDFEIKQIEDVHKLLMDKNQLGQYLLAMIQEVEALRKEVDVLKKNCKPRLRI